MNGAKLKANLIFIFSAFGSFFGSSYVTKNYGSKIHAEYGESGLATGIVTGAIYKANKIPNAEVALGVIAGSGMNALFTIGRLPKVNEKLPKSIQAVIGNSNGAEMAGNNLDDYSDEELMGNERVIEIARDMAENEKEAYINALIAASEPKTLMIENQTVGSSLPDDQAGLDGEENELEGNSLD